MMEINKLFYMIKETNTDLKLVGTLELEDEHIKWSYDGLGYFGYNMEEHLNDIFNTDTEIIEDFFIDNNIYDCFYFFP
ncbi:MAG: hypothetical protein ACLFQA_12505 [Bacteroidales bacterium]